MVGRSELPYRQDLRDLERLVTSECIIGRKKRKVLNRFLEHADTRIRQYAERLAAEDIRARNYLRLLEDGRSDECEEDDLEWRMDASEKPGPIDSSFQDKPLGGFDDDDIPF